MWAMPRGGVPFLVRVAERVFAILHQGWPHNNEGIEHAVKSILMRGPNEMGYFDYLIHIRLLYVDIFPSSDIFIINTVGIEGSGSHQSNPCDFLIAGVDFFVHQSYLNG